MPTGPVRSGPGPDEPVARAAVVPSPSPAAGRTYVAVGASETVGVGADHPRTEAWPRVLHDSTLSSSTFVNLGVSGATVGEALAVQLPVALAAQPDVVTVWLAVNDLTHLVPVSAYEQQLRTLVHQLRRDGRTTVLVGNMPPVDRMPAYLACLPGAVATDVRCQLPIVPPPERGPRAGRQLQRGDRPGGPGRSRGAGRPVPGPRPHPADQP